MNKRKILTLALSLCMIAILAVGGTLAYFTESETQKNEFTIGDLKIDLFETVKHTDALGDKGEVKQAETVLGKDTDTNVGYEYAQIMPGDIMTKVATVVNESTEPVYVTLSVKQNNYLNFNQNIDDYYEAKGEDMQTIIDAIFPGWNLQYAKDKDHLVRYMMNGANGTFDGEGEGEVVGLGYANSTWDQTNNVKCWNYDGALFDRQLAWSTTKTGEAEMDGSFHTIDEDHTRVWFVYLQLDPGVSYTLDLTTVCPDFIDNSSINAFDDMALNVQAAAIQCDGFADEYEAFSELHKTFGFSY